MTRRGRSGALDVDARDAGAPFEAPPASSSTVPTSRPPPTSRRARRLDAGASTRRPPASIELTPEEAEIFKNEDDKNLVGTPPEIPIVSAVRSNLFANAIARYDYHAMKRALFVVAACGGGASQSPSPEPATVPVATPAPADAAVALPCDRRVARAKSHIEHAAESARANLEPIMRIGEVPALAQFDGTEREASAVFVRLVSDTAGLRAVVSNGPPMPLTSDAQLKMLTKQVRAQSGANVIELALPSRADSSLLGLIIVELSKTAPVRVLGARSGSLDRSAVVVADTPAWAAKVARIEDGAQARDAIVAGMKKLTATCEPLHQAFASISGASEIVTKLPSALAQCDCSASNPEAVATLAAMMIATATIEIGWIEVRGVAKSPTKLRATGTMNDVVAALALIPAQTRRAGVEFD